jgi:hypothetical protein
MCLFETSRRAPFHRLHAVWRAAADGLVPGRRAPRAQDAAAYASTSANVCSVTYELSGGTSDLADQVFATETPYVLRLAGRVEHPQPCPTAATAVKGRRHLPGLRTSPYRTSESGAPDTFGSSDNGGDQTLLCRVRKWLIIATSTQNLW